jgi:hypothetical protein
MPLGLGGRAAAAALILSLAALAVLARESAGQVRPRDGRSWSWREAAVDLQNDHLELFYGSPEVDPERWVLMARVGKPEGHVFPVQWLLDSEAVEHADGVRAVRHDLDFYLTVAGGSDPWSYAWYHCRTASNLYGHVHWVCLGEPTKSDAPRGASRAPGHELVTGMAQPRP